MNIFVFSAIKPTVLLELGITFVINSTLELPTLAYQKQDAIQKVRNMIEFINVTDESMRNYHYLWYTYTHNINFTLMCPKGKHTSAIERCLNQPLNFFIPLTIGLSISKG